MQYGKIDVARRGHGKHHQPRDVPQDSKPTNPGSQQPGLEQGTPKNSLSQECQDDIDDNERVELLISLAQAEGLGCHNEDPRKQVRGRARSCQDAAIGILKVSFEQSESDEVRTTAAMMKLRSHTK